MLVCRIFNDIRSALDHGLYEPFSGRNLVQNGLKKYRNLHRGSILKAPRYAPVSIENV